MNSKMKKNSTTPKLTPAVYMRTASEIIIYNPVQKVWIRQSTKAGGAHG